MAEPEHFYRSDHHPAVGADVKNLPTKQLQRIALERIFQLCRREISGRPLEARPGWHDLSNCHKLYFDEQEHDVGRRLNRQAPRWRIVYRLLEPLPGRDRRARLQVVAVGPRYQGQIYATAGQRLARPEVKRAQRQPDSDSLPQQANPRSPSWEAASREQQSRVHQPGPGRRR